MIYAKEPLGNCIKEMVPLLVKHWEEVAVNKDKVPLEPKWSEYFRLEEVGALDTFTARDDDGTLVGYCLTFKNPHLHYWSTLMASVDIVYVTPKHRGKMTGVRLMKFTEDSLKKMGVKVIHHHVKLEHNFGPILKRMGYSEVEAIHSKYIGD